MTEPPTPSSPAVEPPPRKRARCRETTGDMVRSLAAALVLVGVVVAVNVAGQPDPVFRDVDYGHAQRVALARTLASEPRLLLLLLDEPLGALDGGTRLSVRADLRRHLAHFEGATVVVTHDALDVFVLADRLVVLEEGRVVQEGAPADVADVTALSVAELGLEQGSEVWAAVKAAETSVYPA